GVPAPTDKLRTGTGPNSVSEITGLNRSSWSKQRPKEISLFSRLPPVKIGQEAGICTRTVSFTGRDAAVTPQSWGSDECRLTSDAAELLRSRPSTLDTRHSTLVTRATWGPWSDSHRRIRVYETRPVAAEAQGRKGKSEGRRSKAERNPKADTRNTSG